MHPSRLHRNATVIATIAGALASVCAAGPLNKSHIPADASWLVHFDAEAMLKSTMAKALLADEGFVDLADLDQVKEEFGLDPLNDIKDATVFGWDSEGEDAVVIVTATPAIDDAIAKLKEKGHEYQSVKEGGYEIYSWADGDHRDGEADDDDASDGNQYGLVRNDGGDRRLVYIARDKAHLIAAADLAGGKGESLKGRKDSALASTPGSGAILFIATDVIPKRAHDEEMSMVLRKARAVRLELGESDQNCYADLQLTMASREDATNVVAILTGLQAMARMFCQNNPDLAPLNELLDAQSLSTKDTAILASVKFPSEKVVAAMKAAKEHDEGDDADEGGKKEHHHEDGEHEGGKKDKKPI